ncbi:MAG: SMC-Scp complex subunit ScpB [Candidatus Marinimicrobia bacterium]|nr:SMC-Scp complex subunit ScpB [Candidatus Neomarinimicrobiota bacterium]
MHESETKNIIEALLFASRDPLTQVQVNQVFEPDTPNLEEIVVLLNEQYNSNRNSFIIKKVAGGFQIVTRKQYEYFIKKLLKKSSKFKLSIAAMDSLAIIAYKQPISRYEIEAIRGVDSSGVLKTLLNFELIKIKGRGAGPGRPLLYKTTNKFLDYFGLNRLSDMPKLKEISELIDADPTLGEQISVFINENASDNNKNE